MPTIRFEERTLTLLEGESVLDCLEREGLSRPSSCRSGVCQSCVMKVTQGEVPERAQAGLKPARRALGHFLPCVCEPTDDLVVQDCDDVATFEGQVHRVQEWPGNVLCVHVTASETSPMPFPGQFVLLKRPEDGLTRPYSVARVEDGQFELHVAVLPNGQMSQWLRSAEGERVIVRGPHGECFYQASSLEQPLLLVGTGTGLAPLLGVVQSALAAGHVGPIRLYHGSLDASGLYMRDTLRELADQHANLHVELCAVETAGDTSLRSEPIDRCVFGDHPKLDGQRVYLCGNPQLVQTLRKRAFLAGANLQEIHSDPFLPGAPKPGD